MININYRSDFKIKIKGTGFTIPFKFVFFTNRSNYEVSYLNGVYKNCRLLEDGSLLAIFDNHALNPGNLKYRSEFFLTDDDFSDRVCNKIDVDISDINLTTCKSDDIDSLEIQVYPNYQKGDKGEDMTWEKMTEGNKQEIFNKFNEYVTIEDFNIKNI